MKAILYSVHPFERIAFDRANSAHIHELTYLAAPRDPTTARLAEGSAAVIPSLNDIVDTTRLQLLGKHGVRLISHCAARVTTALTWWPLSGWESGRCMYRPTPRMRSPNTYSR